MAALHSDEGQVPAAGAPGCKQHRGREEAESLKVKTEA